MGLCGCYPACACQVEAGNDLVTVTGTGDSSDPFIISGVETPFSLTNVDGGINVTPGGPSGHEPIANLRTNNTGTIALDVTPLGLEAHLLNAPSGTGGVPTGTPLPYLGNVAPPGFLMASGPNYAGYVPAVDHPALFALIGHMGSGGVDPGDGTFRVPDYRDRVGIGQGTLGGLGTPGGQANVTLDTTQIPNHGHGVVDPGHDHGATTGQNGAHSHDTATAGRVFVEADLTNFANVSIDQSAIGQAYSIPVGATGGAPALGQRTDAATAQVGTHPHTIDGDTTGVSVADSTGGGGSHTNMQPYIVENVIIKD